MGEIQEERLKRLKMLKKGLIVLGVLLIILVIALIGLQTVDSKTSKMFLDEKEIEFETLVNKIEGETYVNLNKMTRLFPSFTYSTGEYFSDGTVNQDPNYFHLKSPYEVIQFKKESDKVSKIILIDNNYYQYDSKGNKILTKEEESKGQEVVIERQEIDNKKRSTEEFDLSAVVQERNKDQYIPLDDIKYVFNLQIKHSGNSTKLYTVEYLERAYASSLNKSNLHLNPNYQNRRAILDGYFITTTNSTNPVYGVQIYENGLFTSQISESYKDIRYMQTNKTIFVINNQNAFGLINIDKAVDVIKPGSYEAIEAYVPELDLYQVQNAQGKLGVIEASGETVKTIVHTEYDEIGYDTYKFIDEGNGKIFFNSLIPAKKDNRWYIFDLENTNKPYGSDIKGYLDIGYKKPELLSFNSRNEPELTDDQIKELTNRGLVHLTKEDRGADEATKLLRLQALAKEGFVLNQQSIPDGDSLLIVPDSTGYGGLIVKSYLSSGQYVYFIISLDAKIRAKDVPYSLTTPFKRIYKLSSAGLDKYYAVSSDDKVFQLIKQDSSKETNQNTNTQENSSNEN